MRGVCTLDRSLHDSGFGHRTNRRRSPLLLNRANCLALFFLILGTARLAAAQTLVVTSDGQTENRDATVLINNIPNMPNLVLSVNGGTSCDTFSYQVSITYADQAGATTGTNVTFGAQDVVGDQSSTVSWSGNFEGGNGTISWQFDGLSEPSFTFKINGVNPPNNIIDSYLASGVAPWFTQNLVAWESRAYSLSPSGYYKQFDPNNSAYPVLWGKPDGVGLMQVEPPNRLNGNDLDFWAWSQNIADGLHTLSNILASNTPCPSSCTGPYGNWTKEYTDMINNTAGNPVPASWPGDCLLHANNAICAGFGPTNVTWYCSFSSSDSNGSPNGFGDANWIHAYNGYYFVNWVDGTPQIPGEWEYDDQGPSTGYVYNVCTSAPL